MKLLCMLFGHRMRVLGSNIAGPSKCSRCGHVEPMIEWPTPPPMPKIKTAQTSSIAIGQEANKQPPPEPSFFSEKLRNAETNTTQFPK